MFKQLVKSGFHALGLKVEWRDRLEEAMPKMCRYESPYLPRVKRSSVRRICFLHEVLEIARNVEGDFVECGTLIGHGLLNFILLSEQMGTKRTYYAFDSFAGFPPPTEEDGESHAYAGYLASPPELVLRVLQDGGVPAKVIDERLQLVQGFFCDTLSSYEGRIAVLHLDCDLYQSYQDCLSVLYDRVMPGGVILMDDYKDRKFPGATRAIDEFFEDKPETVQLVPGWSWGWHIVKQG
jgi:hypothetical protein